MGSNLADIHGWIDDFARGKRIQNYEVICPGSTIWEDASVSKHDLKNYWGADPVHLALRGYEKLVEKLVGKLEAERSKKRSREDCEAGKQRQKPRLDHSDRKTGISRSDTVAERWEGSSG